MAGRQTLQYDSYTGNTVHRFYQVWQLSDCNVTNATPTNPSGCLNDLYPFVALAREDSGGNSLGFYNVQNGDAPVLAQLADEFTVSDDFHQSVMGDRGEPYGARHGRCDLLDDLRRADPAAGVDDRRPGSDFIDLGQIQSARSGPTTRMSRSLG